MDAATLRSTLRQAREAHAARRGQRDSLLAARSAAAEAQAAQLRLVQLLDGTIALLKATSDRARTQARDRIERLVTSSLQSVFGPDYAFRIELTEKAGRPEAEFWVVSTIGGETVQTRPQDSRGGGVVDVVSLALRVAMLETYRPRLDGPLLLDEPAKHVSDEFIAAVGNYVKTMSQVFGRQTIMVTHSAHLAALADVSYHVQLQDGVSVATTKGGIST